MMRVNAPGKCSAHIHLSQMMFKALGADLGLRGPENADRPDECSGYAIACRSVDAPGSWGVT
jgi:cytosine/adenosine deaminase-related metal-dependent hydrolase